MKTSKYCVSLFWLMSVMVHMNAKGDSSLQYIDDKIRDSLLYITDEEKEAELKEKDRFDEYVRDDRYGIMEMLRFIANQNDREKPADGYLNTAEKRKHNNLLQAMATFVKGKENRKKIINKSEIDSFELLKKGNFIDKLCLYFDLDKLADDVKTLGEAEAVRRYSEDISLDKLFFLYKILNYKRNDRLLVENKQILEFLCNNPETLEALFQNLQEMKSAQDFLLLFNDQISFLNQCGFSNLELDDCLGYFSFNEQNMNQIKEYGQNTAIYELSNINCIENIVKQRKVHVWDYIDVVNPFAYISWLSKKKTLHNLFDVLHFKQLLFGCLLCFCVKYLAGIFTETALSSIIYHIVLFTTMFNYVFRFFTSIQYPLLFALLAGILSCCMRQQAGLLFLVLTYIIKAILYVLKNTCGYNPDEYITKYANNDEEIKLPHLTKQKQPAAEQQPVQQQQEPINDPEQEGDNVDPLGSRLGRLLNSIFSREFLKLIGQKIKAGWGKVGKYVTFKSVGLLLLGALLVYLAYKLLPVSMRYNSALHKYVCDKLNKVTLRNARTYVKNMRAFYNTIKSNPVLYNKLKKRLKACYLLFDKKSTGLTKRQRSILKILNIDEKEIRNHKIVKFFCLFDENVKSLFRKAIREIYDVSTYINSAHLVSTKKYCIARFINDDTNYILMKSMLHPYLTEGIKNNVEFGEKSKYKYRNLLFTGSNRSGKTTFIAALALNVLLAHVFGIAFCDTCILTPFDKIITIFNYETDINDQQSKYSNEIKILRSLVEYLSKNKKLRILFASDEQFSSTDPGTANYLMSCFLATIYSQKNITSLNSTHLALPRKLADLFQDELAVCNVSLKTVIEDDGKINFKRILLRRNGLMIGEQLARNMGFFEHLNPKFVNIFKNIEY